MAETRRGRPPTGTEAKRASFNTRVREAVLARVKTQAEQNGKSVSEEIEFLLENYSRDDEHTKQTLAFMLGGDDAALLLLIGQVMRVLRLRGEYLDDPKAYQMLGRGIGHLFKRLAAPDDGHVSHDKSIESGIDRLLYELGAEPYDPWGAPTYLERWAQEQRARLGSFGPLLVKMHQAVRDGLLQAPSRDLPQPNPEHVEAWERAREKPLAETAAHRASEAEAAAKAGERRRRGKQKGEN